MGCRGEQECGPRWPLSWELCFGPSAPEQEAALGLSLLSCCGSDVPPASGGCDSLQGMAQAHRTPQPRAAPSQPRAFKLVLLGSGSVGKSSLALRYVKNDFKNILPTVGCK